MNTDIDTRSLWGKILGRLIYSVARLTQRPFIFNYQREKGEPVGCIVEVHWMSFHDMDVPQIFGALTRCLLIEGRPINAYRIIETHRVAEYTNMSLIQPLWVENLGKPTW